MSFNDTLKDSFILLIVAGFCGAVVMAVCVYVYPFVAGVDDPTAFTRAIVLRVGFQTLGNLCLMAGLLFANLILPKDFLEKVSEDSTACAIILCAVLLALAWINS